MGRPTVWFIVISQDTNVLGTPAVQLRGRKQPLLQGGNSAGSGSNPSSAIYYLGELE